MGGAIVGWAPPTVVAPNIVAFTVVASVLIDGQCHTSMSEKYLALKAVMMPRDTNPHGTIFGGVIMSYIDHKGINI